MNKKLSTLVFTVSAINKFSPSIEFFHRQFGENIPSFTPLEGGEGMHYLVCIDKNTNVKNICSLHGYSISSFPSDFLADIEKYNKDYRITFSYNKNSYELIKNIYKN